jgi:hypothetical protein
MHQDPGNPRVLVGQGHGGPVPPPPFHQRPKPLTPAVALAAYPPQTTPGPMHQQFPQIAIAMFADPKQAWLPARALLPEDPPEPGRKLAAIFALGGIADRRH